MKLIAGLGNPGVQYQWTRHNLGFLVLEALSARCKASWHHSSVNQGMVAKTVIDDVPCSLLMPLTFMNNSGIAVNKLAAKHGVVPEDILIVCDDLSLKFGGMRLRPSGSAGGHNGLKSVIELLGTKGFARLRLGIDKPKEAEQTVNYVLANFTPAEKKALPGFINHALDCVTCWVTEGAQAAMNKFN